MNTIKTQKLQELVAKSVKGVGYDKNIPMTTMMGITVNNGKLTLSSTDATNYLYITGELEGATENIDISVYADVFSKLVAKLTTEETSLKLDGRSLVVTANGQYTMSLPIDENGNLVVFPKKSITDIKQLGIVSTENKKLMLTSLRPSLSAVKESVYSNYYIGELAVSTDRAMMCVLDEPLFEEPKMLRKEFVDLWELISGDVAVAISGTDIVTKSAIDGVEIYSKVDSSDTEFNLEGVKKMVAFDNSAFCKIRKADLLSLLERIALFVGAYDDSTITMKFTDTCLEITSKTQSGSEAIDYMESINPIELTTKIDINRLIVQLKSYPSDVVELWYGSDFCIKLTDGKLSQVLALVR